MADRETPDRAAARREAGRRYQQEYRNKVAQDPEKRAAYLEKKREKGRKLRAEPGYLEDMARKARERRRIPEGHPGTCDICGIAPEPSKMGRGLREDHRHDNNVIRGYLCNRCNCMMGTIDLRYTDPERFAAMIAYSTRGEPVAPVRPTRADRRKPPVDHPKLFE